MDFETAKILVEKLLDLSKRSNCDFHNYYEITLLGSDRDPIENHTMQMSKYLFNKIKAVFLLMIDSNVDYEKIDLLFKILGKSSPILVDLLIITFCLPDDSYDKLQISSVIGSPQEFFYSEPINSNSEENENEEKEIPSEEIRKSFEEYKKEKKTNNNKEQKTEEQETEEQEFEEYKESIECCSKIMKLHKIPTFDFFFVYKDQINKYLCYLTSRINIRNSFIYQFSYESSSKSGIYPLHCLDLFWCGLTSTSLVINFIDPDICKPWELYYFTVIRDDIDESDINNIAIPNTDQGRKYLKELKRKHRKNKGNESSKEKENKKQTRKRRNQMKVEFEIQLYIYIPLCFYLNIGKVASMNEIPFAQFIVEHMNSNEIKRAHFEDIGYIKQMKEITAFFNKS